MLDELLSKEDFNSDSLLAMVKDKYGNYVVQRIIEFSDAAVKDMIISKIAESSSIKKKDGYCNLINSETRYELHREERIFS